MKKYSIHLVLILSVFLGFSQQDSQFTQYMYNTININPAYAGSRETLSIFGLHRSQWVGLDGAPRTNALSAHTPLGSSNLGLGLSILNDKIGPSDENSISADISYYINTSDRFKLSFGVKATANLLNIDFGKLNIYSNDPLSQYNVDNKFSPNVGAGLYLYSEKTYLGISVPNFLETEHFDKGASTFTANSVASERMHIYLIGGHVFRFSDSVQFKPAFLTKVVQGSPLQADISANFLFNDRFTAGVAYRWDAAMSALLGFQISDSWFIGYGYDMEVTKLANYNSGSHEIFLRYELFNKRESAISPRFF